MFKDLITIVLVLVTMGECVPAKRGYKVYRGDKLPDWGENPHKFIVMLYGNSICTGSIYSPMVVLSAGHCFMESQHQPTFIALEHTNTTRPFDKTVQIAEVHIPDVYNRTYSTSQVNGEDCAVVILEEPIHLHSQQHVILPFLARVPPPTTEVIIIGYGKDSYTGENAGILKFGISQVVNCRSPQVDERICVAAQRKFRYQRTEPGDSGGPLIGIVKGIHYGLGMLSGGYFYSDGYVEVVYSAFIRHADYITRKART